MDDKELEEELRRRSQFYELGYQVEQLKAVIAKELRLELIVKFLDMIIRKVSRRD